MQNKSYKYIKQKALKNNSMRVVPQSDSRVMSIPNTRKFKMPSGGSDLPSHQHFQSTYSIVPLSNDEDKCLKKKQVAPDFTPLFPPTQRNKGYLEIAFPPEASYSLSPFSLCLP